MSTRPPSARRQPDDAPIRLVALLLIVSIGLAMLSGCDVASPETRAQETAVARYGTWTPTSEQATRAAIARGTREGIDPTMTAELTAEASLVIATPVLPMPPARAAHYAPSIDRWIPGSAQLNPAN